MHGAERDNIIHFGKKKLLPFNESLSSRISRRLGHAPFSVPTSSCVALFNRVTFVSRPKYIVLQKPITDQRLRLKKKIKITFASAALR